ncbi:MAG: hypothetical protein GY841_14795 [FCB group bacterium]|nr:hypothetical protein [FCB group bacterium]
MPWNPWVEIAPDNTEDPAVKKLYDHVRHPISKEIPDLVRLTSSTPEVAVRINDLRDAVAANKSGLSLREKEISALLVAVYNGCVH